MKKGIIETTDITSPLIIVPSVDGKSEKEKIGIARGLMERANECVSEILPSNLSGNLGFQYHLDIQNELGQL